MRIILLKLPYVSKEDLKSVPVEVRLHDVPTTTFMEDGLSTVVTKLGTPLMLDTYTASAKLKDTDFKKVSNNNNYGSKSMVDVASSSGTKIVTSNPFDVFNMVEKDIRVAPSDLVKMKGDVVNVRNSKDVNLNNEDSEKTIAWKTMIMKLRVSWHRKVLRVRALQEQRWNGKNSLY
ncbi:hypothetical protein Tco_0446734 [Tanacetum coccineum]